MTEKSSMLTGMKSESIELFDFSIL
jgi:hypothetical protein